MSDLLLRRSFHAESRPIGGKPTVLGPLSNPCTAGAGAPPLHAGDGRTQGLPVGSQPAELEDHCEVIPDRPALRYPPVNETVRKHHITRKATR